MPYGFLADLIAGFHAALIIYFLGAWLIPFTGLPMRAASAFALTLIFGFFYFSSACPLTLLEYHLRIAAGEQIKNQAFLERLAPNLGISIDPASLSYASFYILSLVGIMSLIPIAISLLRRVGGERKINSKK
ncbi:MAG: DUF2784 family protein [Patescibacteria group bacterium]